MPTLTPIAPVGATVPGATHHSIRLDDTTLHLVSAGSAGSPIVLVHGWPETWWAFRELMPLLAASHRVYALDLRGFGDSSVAGDDVTEQTVADDLHRLVDLLDVGPVHLLCQDISGGAAFRFAAEHPEQVLSFTAVESSLAGFGLEALADVNAYGSWHVGFLGAPGIASMLLPGHERELLTGWAYPLMTAPDAALAPADIDEFVRSYSRPGAWRGTEGLYHSLFADDGATRALAESSPLTVPVLAVDGANSPFTEMSFRPVAAGRFEAAQVDGCGHLVAQENPHGLAEVLLPFVASADAGGEHSGVAPTQTAV
ncbi:alpha/beta fold hydrolase [Herbiconiux sp. A18JL235]|uniref:Alpha/beta fold hydrolase n=1 Tax=Herbiconiux sp. A18JL235 TaxID=3152363 RepID=A0AB39BER6_9MICO